MNNASKVIFQYMFSITLLGLFWEVMVIGFSIPDYILPPPRQVLVTLVHEVNLFAPAFSYTIMNTLVGGFVGIILGVSLAMFLAYSSVLRWIVEPYLLVFQSFPRESLFPLFLIWLGFGVGPKIMNAFLLSFFPVAVIVLNALINVEESYIKLIRSWYASKTDEFFKCRLPYAIPQIVSAVKVALPLALIGAVLGEFMGGNKGLGYIIISSGGTIQS